MKKCTSLAVVALLATVAGTVRADYHCEEGPLERGRWAITPFVGVAPSIFASHRAHQYLIVPRAAQSQSACEQTTPLCNTNYADNTFQEGPCIGKFGDIFKQGVLHVGVRLEHNVCDRTPWFLEFVYNRASGDADCYDPFNTIVAPAGCLADDCSTDCNTSCNTDCNDCEKNDCCPSTQAVDAEGNPIANICAVRNCYDAYQAYGGYIGARHYTNRFWCDSTAWWFGFKVGILHRNQVDACTTVEYPNDCSVETPCASANRVDNPAVFNRAVFCKSNSVSGGLQMGFDYCYNDCFTIQLGFEVVASCGLRGNKNLVVDPAAFKNNSGETLTGCNFPSNVIVCNTGAVLNFPIWVGLRYEFDWCDPCNSCDPCA